MSEGVVPFVDIYPATSTAAGTRTLPLVSASKGQIRIIINESDYKLSIATISPNLMYTNQERLTHTLNYIIPPKSSRTFINDGTYWALSNGPLDGIFLGEQWISLNADYSLVSNTTGVQPIFNIGAGYVSVVPGLYFFEAFMKLSALSGTSGTFGFALGAYFGLTLSNPVWSSLAKKSALSTPAAPEFSAYNAASSAALTANNTNTIGVANLRGSFRVTATGALRPEVSLSTAAAAKMEAGSYFRLFSAGREAATIAGDWQ